MSKKSVSPTKNARLAAPVNEQVIKFVEQQLAVRTKVLGGHSPADYERHVPILGVPLILELTEWSDAAQLRVLRQTDRVLLASLYSRTHGDEWTTRAVRCLPTASGDPTVPADGERAAVNEVARRWPDTAWMRREERPFAALARVPEGKVRAHGVISDCEEAMLTGTLAPSVPVSPILGCMYRSPITKSNS
jgi:hypothetical protein